jgi:hypothetical protein
MHFGDRIQKSSFISFWSQFIGPDYSPKPESGKRANRGTNHQGWYRHLMGNSEADGFDLTDDKKYKI